MRVGGVFLGDEEVPGVCLHMKPCPPHLRLSSGLLHVTGHGTAKGCHMVRVLAVSSRG